MKIIADLHLHSKYSRAVSQEMMLPQIAQWAVKKGIGLVGTGDWTHPLWLREIKANLEEVTPGLYRLKEIISGEESRGGSRGGSTSEEVEPLKESVYSPLFLLSTEISSIYSQGGKLRRIHNLVLAPSIEVVEKINKTLVARGANLMSDGRPVTGIPAPDLVKLILGVDQNCLIIPAHAWTPWFSLYGSESGFDSINECFGETACYIYAVETGLSSSPEMNWRIKELDSRQIVSFSDAHSGPKLGRETTVFEIEDIEKLRYEDIRKAIIGIREWVVGSGSGISNGDGEDKTHNTPSRPNSQLTTHPHISYTIEFHPEEGKYHFTGHRDCKVRQSPEETRKQGSTCPVCGKRLTVGVMHRVEQLTAQQIQNSKFKIQNDEFGVRWIGCDDRPPYVMLVPLQEILAESLGGLPASQNVQNEYEKLTREFGGEFKVLLATLFDKIARISGEKVAEAIRKVRAGDIVVEPGYDGVFGTVKIWKESVDTEKEDKEQLSLF